MTNPSSAHHAGIEEVAIEKVQLLDHIFVGPGQLRCVISKACARLTPNDRIAGWRLEFAGGESAWFKQHARVARRLDTEPLRATG